MQALNLRLETKGQSMNPPTPLLLHPRCTSVASCVPCTFHLCCAGVVLPPPCSLALRSALCVLSLRAEARFGRSPAKTRSIGSAGLWRSGDTCDLQRTPVPPSHQWGHWLRLENEAYTRSSLAAATVTGPAMGCGAGRESLAF